MILQSDRFNLNFIKPKKKLFMSNKWQVQKMLKVGKLKRLIVIKISLVFHCLFENTGKVFQFLCVKHQGANKM